MADDAAPPRFLAQALTGQAAVGRPPNAFIMCCFSRPVQQVSGTQIFARFWDAWQVLVYSMTVATRSDNAMVLPLPVVAGLGEKSIRFVSLEGYPTFFRDMHKPFVEGRTLSRDVGAPAARSAGPLVVHEVGNFEASCVPSIDDFDRLDERFRLSPAILQGLPQYQQYAFAVFKLRGDDNEKPDKERSSPLIRKQQPQLGDRPPLRTPHSATGARTIHPMAMLFATREPQSLFYPTLHIHDGRIEREATFDHNLYAQHPANLPSWEESTGLARAYMHVGYQDQSRGLVNPNLPIQWKKIRGFHANQDVLVPVNSAT
jgi:hypothetical protein